MAINRSNGGVTGVPNKPSHGGDTITNFKGSTTWTVPTEVTEVDVTVVAGGGGGANTSGQQGGGGGAGGFRTATNQPVIGGTSISVTVGAGGSAGSDGGDSVFANPSNPITSTGGGKGGAGGNPSPGPAAGDGGSGGGVGWNQAGASGNTPPTSPAQGTDGGAGNIPNASNFRGGAGGGGAGVTATAAVADPSPQGPTNAAGTGGRGAITTLRGVNEYLAGGGGGGSLNSTGPWNTKVGSGGEGGGGQGAVDSTAGVSGFTNMGGGGGGASGASANGTAGGSGTVIVKQKDKAVGVFNMNSQFNYRKVNQWPTQNPYLIGNSIRYNVGDSPHMDFTPSSLGNPQIFTISTWVKRCDVTSSNDQVILGASVDSDNAAALAFRGSGDNFILQFYNAIGGSANNGFNIETNRRFQDPSAWYHIVAAVDTTKSSYTDGVRIYINGKQETSFGTTTYNQNVTTPYCKTSSKMVLGARATDDAQELDGYIAETILIDGESLGCEYFGENDPDNKDVWRPKEYKRSGFGTNGFHLKFQNSAVGSAGASMQGTDSSGNGNHFSTTNLAVTDHTSDSPSNNFATFNPLISGLAASGNATQPTFSEGNCKTVTTNSGKSGGSSTIQISSGKWYAEFEFEATNNAGSTITSLIGVTDSPQLNARSFGKVGERNNDVAYAQTGNKLIGDSSSSFGNTYTTGDIIGVAVDLDNNAIYFSKNGTFQNSGDPTSGASKTNAIALTAPASTVEGGYYFAVGESTSETSTHLANFGAAYPAAISSGNSDANGYGNFEHAVPSGYFSLCTKNLAQYG